jgi:octaprenyl-diphosphate synthase
MTQVALKSAAPSVPSALDELSAAMKPDMLAVNTLILENMQSSVPLIPQLAGYLIASGGKRIRPLMTLASTRLFDKTTTRPYQLAAAVEFIHTATLLHDDVVDESDQRRGKPSANTVFGNQSSVLVGDFLFSRAFELMVADGSIEVLRILSNAAAVITEGEVLQLSIQSKLDTTLDQYLEVIAAKTAVLFSAACEIGPVIAGQPATIQKAMHDYGHNLGMAFQIADDLLDYQADEAQLGKTVGDDFREGKMTSPIIFTMQNATEDDKIFLKRTFEDHNVTDSDLLTVQTLIKTYQADQKTYDLAVSFVNKAIESLSPIPASPLKSTLESLATFALSRKS